LVTIYVGIPATIYSIIGCLAFLSCRFWSQHKVVCLVSVLCPQIGCTRQVLDFKVQLYFFSIAKIWLEGRWSRRAPLRKGCRFVRQFWFQLSWHVLLFLIPLDHWDSVTVYHRSQKYLLWEGLGMELSGRLVTFYVWGPNTAKKLWE
jgi:hypothetical protein